MKKWQNKRALQHQRKSKMKRRSVFLISALVVFSLMLSSCKSKKEAVDKESMSQNTGEAEQEKPIPIEKPGKLVEPSHNVPKADLSLLKGLEDSLFIRLQKTPCFGRCPVYTAKIYNSGYVQFMARKWTKLDGNFTGRISQEQLQELRNQIESVEFFKFNPVYDNTGVTDLPSSILTIQRDDEKHAVVSRYQAPEALNKLISSLDQLIQGIDYKAEESE